MVTSSKTRERPFVFAGLVLLVAGIVTGVFLILSYQFPVTFFVGVPGRHDGSSAERRTAACLDCHVPFVGTPPSRCLSPGCHGELATGAPPLQGPAMPIRFHAALREHDCSLCHDEHRLGGDFTVTFNHSAIPSAVQKQCSRCHFAKDKPNHARTDEINCAVCHDTSQWSSGSMRHAKFLRQPCDLCHVAPDSEEHRSIAGTCDACHVPGTWTNVVPDRVR